MLIIPDVHGREFWRDPIKNYPDEEIIFLGDYLDPYSEEEITPEDAIKVFWDILELKKENPERVTLLLGNHDLMYISGPFRIKPSRHDWMHDSEIYKLFSDNLGSFSLVASRGDYVFSHAGVHPRWLERHPELKVGDDTIEILNQKLWDPLFMMSLSEYSWYRGGDLDCSIGSPVWSDVREWVNNPPELKEGITQIFGHTQLKEGKIIERPGYACIDCKRVVRIDENNKLKVL